MQCGDDNELTAYVGGLLSSARAAAVARHVDECAACRMALAAAAVGVAARGDPAPATPGTVPVHHVIPDQLVRGYLRRDAPARELALARFWAAAAILGLVAIGMLGSRYAVPDVRPRLAILATFLLYEAGVCVALARGHYHPALPFASTLVENGTMLAMTFATMTGTPPGVTGGPLLWIVLIMFTAIRATPWLCMVAGALGAVGFAIPFAVQAAELTATIQVPIGFAAGSGVAFCLLAGVAGATLARYLIGRAEAALREIREQDLFGKYLLHESLGSGGMGQVFRATYCPEGGFTRTVAVKQVRPRLGQAPREQAALRDALRAEARLSAQLAHPNVVQVLDCGTFRGAFVLVMELVDGISLNRLLERGPMKLAPALLVAVELATALDYIHGRRDERGAALGLVHGDVNPPNVLISAIGEVKLCDFGVARISSQATDWQRFAGKTAYAAPEQLRREPLDHRADLYALGFTLFEALTGAKGPGLATTRVRDLRPDVPAELDVLLAALLSLDRELRPDSAAVVRGKLMTCLNNLAPASAAQAELCEAVRLTRTR